ncbi:PAS domain S-box-containing protein [Paucimonas lemoignei]|uniref:PAS domain S-box-containing protein n=1 Tax=Paucimonas lemoignei TaxID=29443 RepID=A0A4R3HVM6_PAULE|nr:PAS domain S-box protein [Paucimonas lemoignei]TCS36824.1 PAS domain S-box-containing protein [Paucimonas lemoignei]
MDKKPDGAASATIHEDLLDCMPEAVIFADARGMIRMWNPGATALFGFGADEALGLSLDLIIPENLRKAHWDGYNQAIERGATAHCGQSRITRALHKDGTPRYVDMSFAVVKNPAGETTGAMAVARDATQRNQEEKQLRKQLAALTARQEPE